MPKLFGRDAASESSLPEASRISEVDPPRTRRAPQVRKDQDTGERMYDVEPEDEKQRMKTPVRISAF